MEALLVGADRLGNIPEVLRDFGISIRQHVSGREKAHQKKAVSLPAGTQMVILFTDFLGHNVMQSFRAAAQRHSVPLVCCRRSVCSLRQALENGVAREGASAAANCANCPRNPALR